MATCKDCVHYDVCTFHITENENEKCMHFKNKADFVEVKHGEWLICCDGYYPYCSKCKEEPDNGEMTNYCPHCGADMRKGENNAK